MLETVSLHTWQAVHSLKWNTMATQPAQITTRKDETRVKAGVSPKGKSQKQFLIVQPSFGLRLG